MFSFHRNFYKYPEKIAQDNFILQHVVLTNVKRRRPRNNKRSGGRSYSVQYFIAGKNRRVPVCIKAFADVLKIKISRLQGVVKRQHQSGGCVAKENRGGDRKQFQFASKREAVQSFIKSFEPLESHYCRGRIKRRIYLHPELNITKMFQMYSDQALSGLGVKIGFFRKIFNTSFNIGFGSPRQDVCSTCLQFVERIKSETNATEKQSLIAHHRIHKLRSKAFFQMLRDDDPEKIVISFDLQKNLPLPKIPDQSAYYSRQLYFHNFTIVVGHSHQHLSTENVHAYVWTEDESSKGSNQVSTSVYHCLNNLNLEGKKIIRLVADGCGGQNKNSVVTGMAMKWLHHAPNHINRVEIVFPVTGHSYIPPDRVFALTEKEIKKKECIIDPKEYSEIISSHATVHNLATDVPVLDWKTQCKEYLRNTQTWHFQISKCKRIILTRHSGGIKARGEISYRHETGISKYLYKRGKNLNDFSPLPIMAGVPIKNAKIIDVKKLITKHYGEDWKSIPELKYYKKILLEEEQSNDQETQDQNNDAEDFLQDEVLNFI